MNKLITKTICIDTRYYLVLRIDDYLRLLRVREIDRQHETYIRYEELPLTINNQ